MKMSRIGILFLLILSILFSVGCSGVLARRDLVDGAEAYKNRKYDEAESKFRSAIKRDPGQKVAKLFLARTLHSVYAADRKKTEKAEEAIVEYKNVVPEFKKDLVEKKKSLDAKPDEKNLSAYKENVTILSSTVGAVANLLDTTGKKEEWVTWQSELGNDTDMPAEIRSNALTSLAAKQYTCANDITDVDPVKKTVGQTFVFAKPAKPEDYDTLKGCITKGKEFIDKALEIQKEAKVETDSTWSYKSSLLIQEMRLAEMDGRTADKENLKKLTEDAKTRFTELATARREKEEAEEKKRKEEEEKNK
jgi:hypothetical protein